MRRGSLVMSIVALAILATAIAAAGPGALTRVSDLRSIPAPTVSNKIAGLALSLSLQPSSPAPTHEDEDKSETRTYSYTHTHTYTTTMTSLSSTTMTTTTVSSTTSSTTVSTTTLSSTVSTSVTTTVTSTSNEGWQPVPGNPCEQFFEAILWGCTTGSTSTTTTNTTTSSTVMNITVAPPTNSALLISDSFSSQGVTGDSWNFSNPDICGVSNVAPQCEASEVDLFSTPDLHMMNSSGGTVPLEGVAASYGTPLSLCQPSYLSFPNVRSGEGVITLCFDEALAVPDRASGTVGITAKLVLPVEVAGPSCDLITAQLVSMSTGNQPVGESGPLSAVVSGTVNGDVICNVTFNIDVGMIAELPSELGTKASFAVVVHEPTTILCIASPVGLGLVTRCGATVTGNSPTGTITWATGGSGKFSTPTCKLSKAFCQVTYYPASGASPVPVSAKYSGDSHNPQSEGIFPLTIKSVVSRTVISCSSASIRAGSSQKLTCTAAVSGFSPSGTIIWNATGTGSVHFSSTTCDLVKRKCSVILTAGTPGEITLVAYYQGDPSNQGSTGTRRILVKS